MHAFYIVTNLTSIIVVLIQYKSQLQQALKTLITSMIMQLLLDIQNKIKNGINMYVEWNKWIFLFIDKIKILVLF